MWVKTQAGSYLEVKAVIFSRKKGEKPKIIDGAGNKLAAYSTIGRSLGIMDDFGWWLSGKGKSLYGGRYRVFAFPSDNEV